MERRDILDIRYIVMMGKRRKTRKTTRWLSPFHSSKGALYASKTEGETYFYCLQRTLHCYKELQQVWVLQRSIHKAPLQYNTKTSIKHNQYTKSHYLSNNWDIKGTIENHCNIKAPSIKQKPNIYSRLFRKFVKNMHLQVVYSTHKNKDISVASDLISRSYFAWVVRSYTYIERFM